MTTTELRCPQCGSLVRGGISWCTLCHADLRTDEERAAARLESEHQDAADVELPSALVLSTAKEPATAAAGGTPGPRGRHARPAPPADTAALAALSALSALTALTAEPAEPAVPVAVPVPLTADDTDERLTELKQAGIDVDEMLHMLATTSSGGLVDDLMARLSTKGARAVAVVVAMSTLTALGILVMFILGSVFG